VKLNYLDVWSQARREKALIYNQLFKEADLVRDADQLDSLYKQDDDSLSKKKAKKVVLPKETEGNPARGGRHIYHQYVIRTDFRSQIEDALDAHHIGHSVYYPVPLHEQPCFSYLGYEANDCPIAHHASETTLALPIYPELSREEQQEVVEVIRNALKDL
jgi:dTDP-4-amino-4,6-dideoxygalactose transaminase